MPFKGGRGGYFGGLVTGRLWFVWNLQAKRRSSPIKYSRLGQQPFTLVNQIPSFFAGAADKLRAPNQATISYFFFFALAINEFWQEINGALDSRRYAKCET